MICWEYASLTCSMKRRADKLDEWTVRGFTASADGGSHKFFESTMLATDFKRVEYFALFGVEGWKLIDTSTNRVTYPGDTLGLGSDNRLAGEHFIRYTFRRPMARPVTESERAAAARFFRSIPASHR